MLNKSTRLSLVLNIGLVGCFILLFSGCVYYNTFYLARKNFNQAESSRSKANRDKAEGSEIGAYTTAIKKASKVLSEHPNSGWVDDALFVIGKSFYYLGDFAKAERKFRELLSNFPDSKFADESRFYLGKSRYKLDNYVLAREIFTEFIEKSKQTEWRAEAVYLMADMYASEDLKGEAIEYYRRFVHEFKSNFRVYEVYMKLGDLQYEAEQYDSAVGSYYRAAQAASTTKEKYSARYQQGRSLYRIDSVSTGMALFEDLRKEQEDSVRLGDILLRIAEGKNLLGDEREAILLYDEIATNFVKRIESAEAYFRLGEITQYAWGDLRVAKDMYELASKEQRGGDWRIQAIDKVADIRKVESYQLAMGSDSAGSAAENRYLLAELYRIDLNRPDSAIAEYQTLVERYPENPLAPRSLLAIGWIHENHFHDTTIAHEYYERVVREYPQSDVYLRATNLLNQETGITELYPDKLYSLAENRLVDAGDLDSAKALFAKLIEEFPDSRLVPKAEFALAKIQLKEFVPAKQPRPSPKIALASSDTLLAVDSATADTVAFNSTDSLSLSDSLNNVVQGDSLEGQLVGVDSSSAVPGDVINAGFADTTRFSLTDSSKAIAKDTVETQDETPDSLAIPPSDSLIRLSDLIGKPGSENLDSIKAAVINGAKDSVRTSDSTRTQVKSDTSMVVKSPAGSVKVAPADTVYIDSTMIHVFQRLAEKYAGTAIGDEALRLAQGDVALANRNQQLLAQQRQQQLAAQKDTVVTRDSITAADTDTLTEAQLAEQYLREEIDKWPLMDDEPTIKGEFTYPIEASTSKFEGRIVVKIKIEFDGKVSEVVFLKGSQIVSIDQQVEKALLETYFDPLDIDPLKIGSYFIYNYEIVLPEVYR